MDLGGVNGPRRWKGSAVCMLVRTCGCAQGRQTTDLEAIYIWRTKKEGVKLAVETDAHRSDEAFVVRCSVARARGRRCTRADVYSTPTMPGWIS